MTSGIAVRVGSSFTPGRVPSGVVIRGTGISRGSGPLGVPASARWDLREARRSGQPEARDCGKVEELFTHTTRYTLPFDSAAPRSGQAPIAAA